MKKLILFSLGFVALFGGAFAQQIPTMEFFHGRECPHCQNQKKWFPTLKQAYPDLVIKEYEVWHDAENQALWAKRMADFDRSPSAVPTNIIGNTVVQGFSPEQILTAMAANFGPPAVDVSAASAGPGGSSSTKDYTWLWIVLVGLVVGCGIAFVGRKS